MGESEAVDRALEACRSAMTHLGRCVSAMEKALEYAHADYWFGAVFLEIPKYRQVFRARREAKEASRDLAKFRERLQKLGRDHQASVDAMVEPGEIALDFVGGAFIDLWVRDRIAHRKRRANIALSRVRRIVRELEGWDPRDVSARPRPGIVEAPRPSAKGRSRGRGR